MIATPSVLRFHQCPNELWSRCYHAACSNDNNTSPQSNSYCRKAYFPQNKPTSSQYVMNLRMRKCLMQSSKSPLISECTFVSTVRTYARTAKNGCRNPSGTPISRAVSFQNVLSNWRLLTPRKTATLCVRNRVFKTRNAEAAFLK